MGDADVDGVNAADRVLILDMTVNPVNLRSEVVMCNLVMSDLVMVILTDVSCICDKVTEGFL